MKYQRKVVAGDYSNNNNNNFLFALYRITYTRLHALERQLKSFKPFHSRPNVHYFIICETRGLHFGPFRHVSFTDSL